MATDTIYLRVTPEIKQRLQEEAYHRKMTMQELMSHAVTLLFEQMDSAQLTPAPPGA